MYKTLIFKSGSFSAAPNEKINTISSVMVEHINRLTKVNKTSSLTIATIDFNSDTTSFEEAVSNFVTQNNNRLFIRTPIGVAGLAKCATHTILNLFSMSSDLMYKDNGIQIGVVPESYVSVESFFSEYPQYYGVSRVSVAKVKSYIVSCSDGGNGFLQALNKELTVTRAIDKSHIKLYKASLLKVREPSTSSENRIDKITTSILPCGIPKKTSVFDEILNPVDYSPQEEISLNASIEGIQIAYVDGSYGKKGVKEVVGGAFVAGFDIPDLENNEKKQVTTAPELVSKGSFGAELFATMLLLQEARKQQIPTLMIVIDCEELIAVLSRGVSGIKRYFNDFPQYIEFFTDVFENMTIFPCKVAGHTGQAYNEKCDRLAKLAVTEYAAYQEK